MGTFFQLSAAQPVNCYLDTGEELFGFIIGRGGDHINLLTEKTNLYLQNAHIVKMEALKYHGGKQEQDAKVTKTT